jgi:hypothetical protein
MKTLILLTIICLTMSNEMNAQQNPELPYAEIPDAPEKYTSGAVVSRMIDGLGFRFYWASEGLRAEDLEYKPSDDARSSGETIDHILGLSYVILNAAHNKVNEMQENQGLSFDEKRETILRNLQAASAVFRSAEDLEAFKIIFKGKDANREFPMWNQINGPISDAIWHCGQLVSMRRASGNPFNSNVSVFTGKVRK